MALLTSDTGGYCPLRISFLIGFAVMMALEVFAVGWKGHDFSVAEFGGGVGAYLASTGLALWAASQQKPAAPAAV